MNTEFLTTSESVTSFELPNGKMITPSYPVLILKSKTTWIESLRKPLEVEYHDHSSPKFCTRDIYGIEMSLP